MTAAEYNHALIELYLFAIANGCTGTAQAAAEMLTREGSK